MAITAAMVKELREVSGAGMMDCKKALTATEGDMDKAMEFLREKGLATAQKKAGRIAAEGIVMLNVSEDGKKAVAVEVNAETDFVAKNEKFRGYVAQVAEQAMDTTAADVEGFLAEPWKFDTNETVGEELAHQMKKDKAKYFGPYTSAGAVKDTIELLRKLYDIRSCNKSLPKEIGKDRPCLYYHIHQCKAPCQGYISKEEYGEQIKKAISFLNGNYNDMIKELTGKMTEAAEEMRFEQAAEYRDLIDSVRRIGERQKITNSDGEDKDVIALAMDKEDAVAQVFFIRNGKLIGREHYYLRIGEEEQKSEVLLTFMKQFYSGTPFIPREIMISEEIAEQELMEEYLSSKRCQKVRIRVPKKGSKEKMVELAERNAQIVLDQDRG